MALSLAAGTWSKVNPCSISTGGNGVIPTGESARYPRRIQEDDVDDGSPIQEDGRSPDLLSHPKTDDDRMGVKGEITSDQN